MVTEFHVGNRVRIKRYGRTEEDSQYVGLEGTVCWATEGFVYVRVRLDKDPCPGFYDGPLCRPDELELIDETPGE